MTSINDLEERINSAEAVLEALKAELEALKQQEPEPESLFGRWATHTEDRRGIIGSDKPDSNGEVRFAYRNENFTDGTEWLFVPLESLDLDPVTLTTEQDFDLAPVNTIAEALQEPHDVYVKTGNKWYVAGDIVEANLTVMPTCRVIRWGSDQ